MEYSSILNEVVKQLEGEANRSRIKKILFCAARGKWENDASKIEECDLRDLVMEVWENNSNLQEVDELLGRIVSKVNKKTEYGLVANKIIENLARLYANEQEATMMETTISNLWESPVETQLEEPLNEPAEEEIYEDRDPGELFDVRQKIMQSANPLKAKILIFSAVERQFNFSDRDWLNLKTRTLDNLLRQLFNVCRKITDLESNLYSAASLLEDADENTQIASTIIEAFKSFYDQESAPIFNQKQKRAAVDNSRKAIEEEEEEGTTYNEPTKIAENTDDGSFDLGEITLINQQEAVSYNPQFDNSLPSLGFTNYGNIKGSTAKEVEKDEEDEEFEETIAMAPPKSLNLETVKPEVTTEELDTQPQDEPKVVENKNILETIKQKLSLEDEIKALVENGVSAITKSMEQEFSKLESVLDSSLAGEEQEKYLSMKYQALGKFVGRVMEMSSKFKEILKQLELEERKTRGLTDRKDFLDASLDSGTQQKTIDLAKEGNPKAIAFIINQYIKNTGVSTIAGWKGDCLHIILESEQVPNQQSYAPFVEKKIISLQSDSLKNVKIHGRKSGNKSIIWTQVVQY